MIYLDHNAGTPLEPAAARAMRAVLDGAPLGNPSSVHRAGQRARAVLEEARETVAESLGADRLEVTFTSGGTEADHLAILGAARALRGAGRPAGLLTSPIEHPAVLGAARAWAEAGGQVAFVELDRRGRVDVDKVVAQLVGDGSLGLVSLAWAHHELGNVYPLPELAARVHAARPEVLVHSDAVQAYGKLDLAFDRTEVDLVSVSSHKIGGPAGIGALAHRRHVALVPPAGGGAQERGFRPGTPSVLLAAGFAAAAAALEPAQARARVEPLHRRLREGLAQVPGCEVHGDPDACVGTTVFASFEGCDAGLLVMALDVEGVCVSTGSACSSGIAEPSPTLLRLGFPREVARSALRISLSVHSEPSEVEALLTALLKVLPRVRSSARS